MATNLLKVVTRDEENLPIMSDGSLITWSREVAWQIENLNLPFRKVYEHQTW